MNRHAIRTRILAAFALALVSMTATLAYGIHQMEAIGQELEAVNNGLLPLSKVSVELGALESLARLRGHRSCRSRGDCSRTPTRAPRDQVKPES